MKFLISKNNIFVCALGESNPGRKSGNLTCYHYTKGACSGKPDLNKRPIGLQPTALPTELLPVLYIIPLQLLSCFSYPLPLLLTSLLLTFPLPLLLTSLLLTFPLPLLLSSLLYSPLFCSLFCYRYCSLLYSSPLYAHARLGSLCGIVPNVSPFRSRLGSASRR